MINRVVLVGRLTKDPDLKYSASGNAVAKFTLAVNRTFTSANGERETDFINVTVFRKQAENAANFLKKGSLAGVDGRIQTGSFEGQDGKRVYTTDVIADSVQFLEPKGAQESRGTSNGNQQSYSNQNSSQGQRNANFNSGPIEVSDDDLPF